MGGAGHAKSAEQQRHQGHQPEVVAEPGQRVGEVLAIVLHRADPVADFPERQAPLVGNGLGLGWIGELDEHLVLRPRPELQQVGGRKIGGGNEDPRADRGGHPDVARDVADRGVDDEPGLAEGQGVADHGPEGGKQGWIDHGASADRDRAPAPRGRGHDIAVVRIAGLEGPDLDQANPGGPGHIGHSGKTGDPSGGPPGAGGRVSLDQGIDEPLDLIGKGLAARNRDIRAEQGFGLGTDRGAEIVGEPVDGHQGRDAGRHRTHQETQAPT